MVEGSVQERMSAPVTRATSRMHAPAVPVTRAYMHDLAKRSIDSCSSSSMQAGNCNTTVLLCAPMRNPAASSVIFIMIPLHAAPNEPKTSMTSASVFDILSRDLSALLAQAVQTAERPRTLLRSVQLTRCPVPCPQCPPPAA